MALHLVTGHSGSAHITSFDQGLQNITCVGEDDFVSAYGGRFNASVVASNTVRIGEGNLFLQGRFITVPKGTVNDLTIPEGTPGMNRNDLIVVRYHKSDLGTETASLVVIPGTTQVGEGVDPSYNNWNIHGAGAPDADFPLYRVKMVGLNIEALEPLFKVYAPLSEFQHGFYKQNMLINGDFQINQRNNKTYDVGGTAAYTVDMWRAFQVKVQVLNEGVTLTGKSASVQGFFTQFIQLGKLTTTTYTIVAMVDDKPCVFTVTPGGTAKEKDFGKFKITALTTSAWDNTLNDYNNKLKINICPIGTSSFTLTYVDVFEGDIAYQHMKEDPATALMRCRRYVQSIPYSTPTLYMYETNSTYAYRFAVTHELMHTTPTVEACSWSYYNSTGETTSGSVADLSVVGNNNGIIQLRTAYKEQKNAQCNAIRGICLLTCEPTDS